MTKRAKLISNKSTSSASKLLPQLATEMKDSSLLFREIIEEREEILRHKWILSEKAGRDVGIYETMVDWVANHRSEWRKAWREKNASKKGCK